VPRDASSAPEGDGWASSLIYDAIVDTSHLAIFDTARWEDGPVARCHFATHVPMTFPRNVVARPSARLSYDGVAMISRTSSALRRCT